VTWIFSVVARMGEVLASEEAGGEISPFIIGGFGLLVLVILLNRHRHA